MILMARVSNSINLRDVVGLTGDAQNAIESASWVVLDAAPDYAYSKSVDENGQEVNKRTDTINGTTVLLGGPRKGDKLVRNREMKVKIADVWTPDDCQKVVDYAPEVRVKVTRAVVWGNSAKNSTFVSINLSIHAELLDEDGQYFKPDSLEKD